MFNVIKIRDCLADKLYKSDNLELEPMAFPSRLIGPNFDSVNLKVQCLYVKIVLSVLINAKNNAGYPF